MTSSNGNIFRVTGPCAGNSPVPGEFPSQRPVTGSFDVFFDLRLTWRLSKQPWGCWFETPWCSLWRHCNGLLVEWDPLTRGTMVSSTKIHLYLRSQELCLFFATRPVLAQHFQTNTQLINIWDNLPGFEFRNDLGLIFYIAIVFDIQNDNILREIYVPRILYKIRDTMIFIDILVTTTCSHPHAFSLYLRIR